MNSKNLEILGLSEGATKEDIEAAYRTLRAKYLEERFMDGEAGNTAAKMLNKIETAHTELLNELNENRSSDGSGESFQRVEDLLKDNNADEAQRVLDGFNERGAYWHYLQSVVFYRKNWINESKKQLEIAIRLEPDNEKFKDTYKKLNEKIEYDKAHAADGQGAPAGGEYSGAYRGQTMDDAGYDNQMGGDFCSSCLQCLACNACLNCMCNGCCR